MKQNNFLLRDLHEPHESRHKIMMQKNANQVKQLMGNNPTSFIWIVLIMFSQYFLAYWVKDFSWYTILILAYWVGAFFSHMLYVFLHEATHNLVFKTTLSNRIVGLMCDWFLIFPGSMAFRKFHLMHHVHQGDYQKDADTPSLEEASYVKGTALKTLWVFVLGVSQALRPMRFKDVSVFDKWSLINLLSQIAIITFFYFTLGWMGIMYLLASTFFCLGLHPLGGRWIAEHYTKTPEQETFSYYGPLNKIMFNIGHHNEHHDFMNVPWNNLPKIKKMFPEMYDNLKSHQSYTGVLMNFIFDKEMNLYSRVVKKDSLR
jgi:sphingolipid delta-4 desaturase